MGFFLVLFLLYGVAVCLDLSEVLYPEEATKTLHSNLNGGHLE